MTCDEVFSKLKSLRDEKMYAHHVKTGVGENQFGVKMGDLRILAKAIKTDPQLARELWSTGNLDAMLLATLITKPKELSLADVEAMVESIPYPLVADWLGTNVVKVHPLKESVREKWMTSSHEFTARIGWSLTAERVIKQPEGLDLPGLLDRLESEMGSVPSAVQWTMNFCLAEIGIKFSDHRARAIAIGEKIGAFRDYPTSKGCTSPYAPIWIAEMVSRQG